MCDLFNARLESRYGGCTFVYFGSIAWAAFVWSLWWPWGSWSCKICWESFVPNASFKWGVYEWKLQKRNSSGVLIVGWANAGQWSIGPKALLVIPFWEVQSWMHGRGFVDIQIEILDCQSWWLQNSCLLQGWEVDSIWHRS